MRDNCSAELGNSKKISLSNYNKERMRSMSYSRLFMIKANNLSNQQGSMRRLRQSSAKMKNIMKINLTSLKPPSMISRKNSISIREKCRNWKKLISFVNY